MIQSIPTRWHMGKAGPSGTIVAMIATISILCMFPALSLAKVVEYHLTIDHKQLEIDGHRMQKVSVNDAIPAPELHFTEGDTAIIHVKNQLSQDSSIHWHGLLLAGAMDGVPGFNDFAGISPGETFTYRFNIRQGGTYWYHAHSLGQEQDGLYGAFIITPRATQDPIKTDRDYVVLLSDLHPQLSQQIFRNLKKSSDYYATHRTVGDFLAETKRKGLSRAWQEVKMWGQMRMMQTDLSDVSGYHFLINGKTAKQNWSALFSAGEAVKLRFINASAMTFFDVRIPGLEMTVVAADGQDVEPVKADEFRFGVAETYDVIVRPKAGTAYSIVAEPIDRSSFAIATLAPRANMRGPAPQKRRRALLTMADMQLHHQQHGAKKHSGSHHSRIVGHDDYVTGVPNSGWARADTPTGKKALTYSNLRFRAIQPDIRQPQREITIRLMGNMERYIWTLNGKKFSEANPIELQYGERVRLTFINETMMAHPMHLHGMFMQLENGQPMDKLPNKHTITVAPGDRYSALLTANESGEWAFHCHLLYHMMAGMMNKVVVAKVKDRISSLPASQ